VLLLFELILFAAIGGKIVEMVRKMEMARETKMEM
jgi:hypothetical protein